MALYYAWNLYLILVGEDKIICAPTMERVKGEKKGKEKRNLLIYFLTSWHH